MAEVKQCRHCRKTLHLHRFVDTSGQPNPRGHYCQLCHLKRLDKQHRAALRRELITIKKLRIIYGGHWRHYAAPEFFHASLHDERDFCPYCGTWFDEITPNRFNDAPLHLDHMDPLDKGGENSIRNVVVCCGPCNIQKGKRSFVDWLAMLEPKYRKLARAIYRHKHGYPPEEFIEGTSTKCGWPYLERTLNKSVAELQKLFPKPVPTSKLTDSRKSGCRRSGEDLPEQRKKGV